MCFLEVRIENSILRSALEIADWREDEQDRIGWKGGSARNTIAKMGKNEIVGLNVFVKIYNRKGSFRERTRSTWVFQGVSEKMKRGEA